MFEFLRGRLQNRASRRASRRRPEALLNVESLEDRAVMSASSGLDDVVVQAAAVVKPAADLGGNSLAKAKNLGTLKVGAYSYTDSVGTTDAADYFKFKLSGTMAVSFRLNNLSDDANIQLLDAKGKPLYLSAQDGTDPETLDLHLTKGTYYLLITPGVGVAQANYRLQYTVQKDTGGDSFKQATKLGKLGKTEMVVFEQIGGLDKNDVYRFDTTANGTVVPISLTGLYGDAKLQLYDKRGLLVRESDFGGLSDELLQMTLGKGTWYVRVTSSINDSTGFVLTIGKNVADPIPGPEDPDIDPFPDVPYYGTPVLDWNLNSIEAPEVWAAGYTGAGVVVAVLDTGVAYNIPELASKIWVNSGEIPGNGIDDDGNGFVDDIRGWDFADGDNNPTDEETHGTHVAGTIAAAHNGAGTTGVAYGATIMPVRVLGIGGGTAVDIAQGIRYAVDNGADIINMSLGGNFPMSSVYDALDYARSKGVFVVVASGNESRTTPAFPARYSANLTNVISVGAYDISNSLADFSNRVGSSGAIQIDAPGVNIASTLPGGTTGIYDGTSMAAPHVAAVAALMLQANPSLTPVVLRALLVRAAKGEILLSDSRGGLNANWAVTAALNPSAFLPPGIGKLSNTTTFVGLGGVEGTFAKSSIDANIGQPLSSDGLASQGLQSKEAVAAAAVRAASAIESFFSKLGDEFDSRRGDSNSAFASRGASLAHEALDADAFDAALAELAGSV